MSRCIFKNCYNRQEPFSRITFFNLPKDERRKIWLQRSGAEELLQLSANARRLVCELHFDEPHIRRQFHRTTLSRDAVPLDYRIRKELIEDNSDEESDRILEATVIGEGSEDSKEANFNLVMDNDSKSSNDSHVVVEFYEEELPEDAVPEESEPVDDSEALDIQHTKKIKFSQCTESDNSWVTSSSALADRNISSEKSRTTEQKSRAENSTDIKTSSSHGKMTEDEYFAMSLVGPLQRLSPEKRAIAKIKILTYLVQLECGIDAQL
ncbi:uncharacterized protein LOC129731161 [Wyeomyia smithii]|uniref:uncharacterized protein LOC129731161 n=1 Tax=Wyeomyia smithii TaxID=174621 RepID=UPI00246802A1|nr:uncharacterized protein LOC129731161 [Wyeomyia smithii]